MIYNGHLVFLGLLGLHHSDGIDLGLHGHQIGVGVIAVVDEGDVDLNDLSLFGAHENVLLLGGPAETRDVAACLEEAKGRDVFEVGLVHLQEEHVPRCRHHANHVQQRRELYVAHLLLMHLKTLYQSNSVRIHLHKSDYSVRESHSAD
jgi:hypothetical protein